MFYVGQKVVCVDDEAHKKYVPKGYSASDGDMGGLTKGRVYTIRKTGEFLPGNFLVWLEEILRPIEADTVCLIYGECGYDPRRFRPIVERKTDISVFTAMLDPSRIKETAWAALNKKRARAWRAANREHIRAYNEARA
jgi:hypothetical protein